MVKKSAPTGTDWKRQPIITKPRGIDTGQEIVRREVEYSLHLDFRKDSSSCASFCPARSHAQRYFGVARW